jgi:integrase
MPAHLIKRDDCGGTFYIVDGSIVRSTKSKIRRYADAQLRQYLDGKFGLLPVPTVGTFYDKWIENKIEPLVRRSMIRDYKQHFSCYILPKFKNVSLADIRTAELKAFQVELIRKGLSVKSCHNIIASSFRAMYRDARAETEALEGKDPFLDLQWTIERKVPDPFSAQERDTILAYIKEHQPFWYPWIFCQFFTGMRPSESIALRLRDIDFEAGTVSINKSRHLRAEGKPKTEDSQRIIKLPVGVLELIKAIRLPWETPDSFVFYNRIGGAIDGNDWSKRYWRTICEKAGVRAKRKFYCTRHTFITEALKRGENPKAVADHCGTSLTMIQKNYSARLQLNVDPTEIQRAAEKANTGMVVPTGYSPELTT